MDCRVQVPDCLLLAEEEPKKKHKRHPIHKRLTGAASKSKAGQAPPAPQVRAARIIYMCTGGRTQV